MSRESGIRSPNEISNLNFTGSGLGGCDWCAQPMVWAKSSRFLGNEPRSNTGITRVSYSGSLFELSSPFVSTSRESSHRGKCGQNGRGCWDFMTEGDEGAAGDDDPIWGMLRLLKLRL